MDWIVSNYQTILLVIMAVIGAASTVVKVIAPLTDTTADNKLLSVLTAISNFLDKLALNPASTAKVKEAPEHVKAVVK